MAEYTYADIIMDPNDPRLEGAIGKECYFSDYPKNALDYARNNSTADRLKRINRESAYPFVGEYRTSWALVNEDKTSWALIIIKKEEPKPKPKYVPFESKEEFIEAYHYHDNAKYSETEDILMNYGMWLWSNVDGSYKLVTEIWNAGVVIGDDKMRITNEEGHIDVFNDTTSWVKLFSEYRFLDGSHCGKEVEE